jgi:hypothetical protein
MAGLINLDTFIGKSLSLVRGQKDRRLNQLAVSELLPTQQTNRSYSEISKIPDADKKIDPQMIMFSADQWEGKWKMIYDLHFPTFGPVDKKDVSQEQLLAFAKKFLKINGRDSEVKYIEIDKCTKERIIYVWNIDKWMTDNFASPRTSFDPPITIVFQYSIPIPAFVWVVSHANLDLRQYIENKFQLYMRKNIKKLHHERFRFLKVINADDFEYTLDYQFSRIKASLKYSVIFGSLAAFMLFNKSIIDKKQLKTMRAAPKTKKEIDDFKKFLTKMK